MLDQLKHTGRISLSSCKENANPHASNATPAEKATLFRRVTAPFRVMAVGGYFSDTDEMSSRPFLFRISRTTSPFLLSSTETATRYPPFLMRSSYAFASYSGIPRPTRPPTTPPAVAPAAAPLSAAIMGPAAINGPKPGIANAPIPASNPTVPPMAPPLTAPVVAPSGAFVALTAPNSGVSPEFGPESGMRREISLEGTRPSL